MKSWYDDILFIDFETYYNTKEGYTLKTRGKNKGLSMREYILDPRFLIQGVGYAKGLDGEIQWIPGNDLTTLTRFLNAVALDESIFCAHNVKFDGSILYEHSWSKKEFQKLAHYIDTKGMARAVFGRGMTGFSLASLAKHYGLPEKGTLKTDGIRDLSPEQFAELGEYCKHDVWLLREIFKRLAQSFPVSEYWHLSWTSRCFVEPVLRLDGAKLQALHAEELERKATIFDCLEEPKETFTSSKKCAAYLKMWGYDCPTKVSKKTGKRIPALASTDGAFIDMKNRAEAAGDDLLLDICEARLTAKSTIMETRTAAFLPLAKLGPFPFDIGYSGARQTHRTAGENGAGGSPQQLPARNERMARMREAILAPEGHDLWVADFSSVEARMVAWLSGEEKLKKLYREKGDPYIALASEIYSRPITKTDKFERSVGKEGILGGGYGMGPKKFQDRLKSSLKKDFPMEMAQKIVYTYRGTFPRIPELWDLLSDFLPRLAGTKEDELVMPGLTLRKPEGSSSLVLPSGLQLKYPGLRLNGYDEKQRPQYVYRGYDDKTRRMVDIHIWAGYLLENTSQALVGELCRAAIKRMEEQGLYCTGQVHDEVHGINFRRFPEEKAVDIIHTAMTTPPEWMPTLVLEAEIGKGKSWAEAKKSARPKEDWVNVEEKIKIL